MTTPQDPMTILATGAAAQHEIFMAYVTAGFTRQEALSIIIAMITTHITDALNAPEE